MKRKDNLSFIKRRIQHGQPINTGTPREHVLSIRLNDLEMLDVAELTIDEIRKKIISDNLSVEALRQRLLKQKGKENGN